jgi:hypothetical protein
MTEVCKEAYERYDDNGIYDAATTYGKNNGGLSCVAQYRCDASGSWEQISGADLKKAYALPYRGFDQCIVY